MGVGQLFFKAFVTRVADDFKQRQLLPLKLLFFVHASTVFVLYPYLTIHMRELGINVKEAAIMSAVTPVMSIIMPPVAGMVADRIGNFKVLLATLSAAGGGVALLLLLVPAGRVKEAWGARAALELSCGGGQLSLRGADAPAVPCAPPPLPPRVGVRAEACGLACDAPPGEGVDAKALRRFSVAVRRGGNGSTDAFQYTLHPDPGSAKGEDHFRTSARVLRGGRLFLPAEGLLRVHCAGADGCALELGMEPADHASPSAAGDLFTATLTPLNGSSSGGNASDAEQEQGYALSNLTDAQGVEMPSACSSVEGEDEGGVALGVTLPQSGDTPPTQRHLLRHVRGRRHRHPARAQRGLRAAAHLRVRGRHHLVAAVRAAHRLGLPGQGARRLQAGVLPVRRHEGGVGAADPHHRPGVQAAGQERGAGRHGRAAQRRDDGAAPRRLRPGRRVGLHRELPVLDAAGPGRHAHAHGRHVHRGGRGGHPAARAVGAHHRPLRPRHRAHRGLRLLLHPPAGVLADLQPVAVPRLRGAGERDVGAVVHGRRHVRCQAQHQLHRHLRAGAAGRHVLRRRSRRRQPAGRLHDDVDRHAPHLPGVRRRDAGGGRSLLPHARAVPAQAAGAHQQRHLQDQERLPQRTPAPRRRQGHARRRQGGAAHQRRRPQALRRPGQAGGEERRGGAGGAPWRLPREPGLRGGRRQRRQSRRQADVAPTSPLTSPPDDSRGSGQTHCKGRPGATTTCMRSSTLCT